MTRIRIIGLTVIAGITAMASLGASGVSASESNITFCEADELVCEKPATHIHQVAENAKLLTTVFGSFITITCLTALFLGEVSSPGGLAHLWLVITGGFTYKHCLTGSGASCTVEELNGPANIEVMKTAKEEAEVLGEGQVLVDCSTTPHCVYNGTNLVGEGLGPLLASPNGEVKYEGVTVNPVEGAFCPETSKLDALFKPLNSIYLAGVIYGRYLSS